MVFIRAKRVKGGQYLYLVKSVWDSKKSTSKQETIKYLGNAADVTTDDIPSKYRNDPNILASLSSYNLDDISKREKLDEDLRNQVYKCFTEGDIEGALRIYHQYIKVSKMDDFYEKIIKPTMYQIGDDWAQNKISVATEHVASNIAHSLVKIITEEVYNVHQKNKVILCTPTGEEHNLGCNIIESFLQSRGYKVFNLSPSAPTESIIRYMSTVKPKALLVSITLEDNLKAGQRLVKKVKEKFKIPVLVGGQALQNVQEKRFGGTVIKESKLGHIPRLLNAAT